MSIDVTEGMIHNAQKAIEAATPYSEDTMQDLLAAVQQSLPAYWKLYEEKIESIDGWSDEDRAIVFRGLASDAIQFVTSRHFGFRLHRIGDKLLSSGSEEVMIELEDDGAPLNDTYPLGMKLIGERIKENKEGENGTVWNPIGTTDEPESHEHLQLLGALSDARLKPWLASQNTTIHFRNCCTTFTSEGSTSEETQKRAKLFVSPAAQILSQDDASKSLHC